MDDESDQFVPAGEQPDPRRTPLVETGPTVVERLIETERERDFWKAVVRGVEAERDEALAALAGLPVPHAVAVLATGSRSRWASLVDYPPAALVAETAKRANG